MSRRPTKKPKVPDVKFEVRDEGCNVQGVMSYREEDEELLFAGGGYDYRNEFDDKAHDDEKKEGEE